jgi:hypothetical protein
MEFNTIVFLLKLASEKSKVNIEINSPLDKVKVTEPLSARQLEGSNTENPQHEVEVALQRPQKQLHDLHVALNRPQRDLDEFNQEKDIIYGNNPIKYTSMYVTENGAKKRNAAGFEQRFDNVKKVYEQTAKMLSKGAGHVRTDI